MSNLPQPVGYSDRAHLYLIRNPATGLVKVGISRNVTQRLYSLEVAAGMKLELLGCVAGGERLERFLHRHFSADRALGEWFRQSRQLTDLAVIAVLTNNVQAMERFVAKRFVLNKTQMRAIERMAYDEEIARS
jgi:hypothetical protein